MASRNTILGHILGHIRDFCDFRADAIWLTVRVQTESLVTQPPAPARLPDGLRLGSRWVPLVFVPHRRARRYILRLRSDGVARVTIPRGGSSAEAWRFAERHVAWLDRQLHRAAQLPAAPAQWRAGTEIYFRGQLVHLETAGAEGSGWIRFGEELLPVLDFHSDWRPAVERHLRRMASRELPPRVMELAAGDDLRVARVTVRDQRTRWGSCSRRGTISLNWRLIQAPPSVCDYIIWHELMHLREMNHSHRFWAEVARVCPGFREAEAWLKQHGRRLR